MFVNLYTLPCVLSCVYVCFFVPLVGWYVFVYVVLYIFWVCECHCVGYVFLCDGLSVYILAQPQKKAR